MIRALLEDRFEIKTHRETRELPIFLDVLVIDSIERPPPDSPPRPRRH